MIGMGFAPAWDVLAGLRVVLGLFEAGQCPRLNFRITCLTIFIQASSLLACIC